MGDQPLITQQQAKQSDQLLGALAGQRRRRDGQRARKEATSKRDTTVSVSTQNQVAMCWLAPAAKSSTSPLSTVGCTTVSVQQQTVTQPTYDDDTLAKMIEDMVS